MPVVNTDPSASWVAGKRDSRQRRRYRRSARRAAQVGRTLDHHERTRRRFRPSRSGGSRTRPGPRPGPQDGRRILRQHRRRNRTDRPRRPVGHDHGRRWRHVGESRRLPRPRSTPKPPEPPSRRGSPTPPPQRRCSACARPPAPTRASWPQTPPSPARRLIEGAPLLISPAVANGVVWGVPADRVTLVIRRDATVRADASVFFTSDRIAVRATMRVGFGFPDPASVQQVKVTP